MRLLSAAAGSRSPQRPAQRRPSREGLGWFSARPNGIAQGQIGQLIVGRSSARAETVKHIDPGAEQRRDEKRQSPAIGDSEHTEREALKRIEIDRHHPVPQFASIGVRYLRASGPGALSEASQALDKEKAGARCAGRLSSPIRLTYRMGAVYGG
jgi:hypothetical protein